VEVEVRRIENTELADIDLWMLCRAGDAAAFTALYRRHASAVLRYAWSILRDQVAAEEAVQDTFLTAWEKRRSSRIVDESLLPWLLVVCRNHSRNILRRARKHRTLPLADDGVMQPETETLTWIQVELEGLSPADRQLCQLCLIHGYTYREAARELEITEAAVGKRLQRLRARLAASSAERE
jgi:RNA polymerase sigma-70 factor (ECF subfamily)